MFESSEIGKVFVSGGHFVIKMFTFFECDTICLLYLLSRVFESINVTKPVTSKEGNSEVYVVCTEFRGDDVASIYLEELLEIGKFWYSSYFRKLKKFEALL